MAEKIIWDFLKKQGATDAGVAGLMGNLFAESGLIANNLQNTYNSKFGMTDAEYTAAVDAGTYTNFVYDSAGFGLAQWTFWSRKADLKTYADFVGKSIGDLEMQLEFLWIELTQSYPAVLAVICNTDSVLDASNAVLLDFERPADQSETVQVRRASYGTEYYEKYKSAVAEPVEEDVSPVVTTDLRYQTIEECPSWAQDAIQNLVDNRYITGTDVGLNLSLDMVRVLMVAEKMIEGWNQNV